MKIKKHLLFQDNGNQVSSILKKHRGENILNPKYLVIHYTAGRDAGSSIKTLTNPTNKVSAHLVISRKGEITQIRRFNSIAWHAGKSNWNGLVGLNAYSIGIELDNAGKMTKHGNHWKSWFGEPYPEEEVLIAKHKHEETETGWHLYTPEQLEVCMEVSTLLVNKYNLIDVLGHEDISPGRKIDPGPAFPMDNFRSRIIGREIDKIIEFQTTTTLNIREGPGSNFKKLPEGPLPPNTKVEILNHHFSWRFIDVLDEINGTNDLQGWVHSKFLELV